MKEKSTANYKIVPEVSGNRYYFYCDVCGALVCITKPYKADTQREELLLAWESEGKEHFNKCHKCGNWVTNVMYNADVLECVSCAPWEVKPNFCKFCGVSVKGEEDICLNCGEHLRYQGGVLSKYEAIRIESMEKFGFGPNEMKKYKVCSFCNTITSTELDICPICSKELPVLSLYELYAKKNYSCSECNTVVPHNSKFCPQCGEKLVD